MGILAYFARDDIPLSLITADVMREIARGEAVAALCEVSSGRWGFRPCGIGSA